MSECPRTEDENRENARLIAAAPELLEACRRAASLLRTLMQMNHLIPENNSVLRECFAAIGRAAPKERNRTMQDSNLPPDVTQADIDDHAEGRINRGLDRLALDIQRYDENHDDAGDAYAVAERIDAHEME